MSRLTPLRRIRAATFAIVCPLITVSTVPTQADIYTYVDKDGVIHFTNVDDPGPNWRRIMKTGPGKAQYVHAIRRSLNLTKARYAQYNHFISEAALLYQIPEPLIRAVIHVESDFDTQAVSRAGARGLMQLMPTTAVGMGVQNIFDPRQNILGGTRFLRVLANRFSGNLALTIAAYHAGPGAVLRYKTIPPYQTTRAYVKMVLNRYEQQKQKSQRG